METDQYNSTPLKITTATIKARPKSQLSTTRYRRTNNSLLKSPIKQAYNQPTYNHLDDLTVKECAGLKEKSPFGFDHYIAPKSENPKRLVVSAFPKSKKITFIESWQKE